MIFTFFNNFSLKNVVNAVFCSLTIKCLSLKSKFHKGIHSTERDKFLNINFRSTDVYKNCCWIGKIVLPEKLLTI